MITLFDIDFIGYFFFHLVRRKYFYSDQNVDIKDPVQLGLLFVQVNTAAVFSSAICGIVRDFIYLKRITCDSLCRKPYGLWDTANCSFKVALNFL